jgi:hypothetical protein
MVTLAATEAQAVLPVRFAWAGITDRAGAVGLGPGPSIAHGYLRVQ